MALISKINRSLSGRAVLYSFGNFAVSCLSAIAAPILVRMMTTSEFGLASVYIAWVALLSKVVGLRIDGTIQNARTSFGEKNLRRYCSSVLSLAALFFLMILAVSVLLAPQCAALTGLSSTIWVLAVVTSFCFACSDLRRSYCSATKNASGDLAISFSLSFLQLGVSILLILLAVFPNAYLDRVVGYSMPTIMIGGGILVYFLIRGRCLLDVEYWRFCLSFSVPMIFNGIAYLLVSQCDRLMLNSLIGSDVAGVYSFACTIALPITVVTAAMGSAWQPEYYELKAAGNARDLRVHANRYTSNIVLITAIIMFISPELLRVFGTEQYYGGIVLLPIMIASYFFQFLYTWPVNCSLFYRKTGHIALATIGAAILNVVLNFVLIPRFGMLGATCSTLASFVALFLLHQMVARMTLPDYGLSLKWFALPVAALVVIIALYYIFLDLVIVRICLEILLVGVLALKIKRDRSLL